MLVVEGTEIKLKSMFAAISRVKQATLIACDYFQFAVVTVLQAMQRIRSKN